MGVEWASLYLFVLFSVLTIQKMNLSGFGSIAFGGRRGRDIHTKVTWTVDLENTLGFPNMNCQMRHISPSSPKPVSLES